MGSQTTKTLGSVCLALRLTLGFAPGIATAQEAETDLLDLSLEELMGLDVLSTSVLGTHSHLAGEWMVGYEITGMSMGGSRQGIARVSDAEVLREFAVAATDMSREMHMIHGMFAPSDDLTLIAMLPHLHMSMDHVTRTGQRFTTESGGFSDLKLGARYTVLGNLRQGGRRILVNAGISLPTGSIDQRDTTPAGPNRKLPYPMQLGSGTVDLLPGVSYLGQSEKWAWLGEAAATIRLGKNHNDYALGNQLRLTAWATRKWTDWLGVTAQVDGDFWGNIDGADRDLNPMMLAQADPERRGGERVGVSLGLDFYVPGGPFRGNRLALGFWLPVYESLDGPQLAANWHLRGGWSWTF